MIGKSLETLEMVLKRKSRIPNWNFIVRHHRVSDQNPTNTPRVYNTWVCKEEVWNVNHRIFKPESSEINADPQKLNNFFNATAPSLLNFARNPQQHLQKFINNLSDRANPFRVHGVSYDGVKKSSEKSVKW